MNLEPLRSTELDERGVAGPGQRVAAMEQLATLAASALRVPLLFIALPGAAGERAVIAGGSGEIPRWSAADEAALWRSGLVELLSGGPFEMRDLTRNYPVEQLRVFTQLRLGSLMGAPIRSASDHLYGVICAAYATPTAWNDDDREMLQQFARLAASELELRRRVEALEANEERLSYDATHDSLTGLATRAALLDRLRVALERPPMPAMERISVSDDVLAPPAENLVAVFAVDVEDVAGMNARFGRQVGDQVLVTLARRLRRAAGRDALVARLGGDRFGALVERLDTTDAAAQLSERLREALEQPVQVGSEHLSPRVRIGASLSATTATLAEHLMHRADVAVEQGRPAAPDAPAVVNVPATAEAPAAAGAPPTAEAPTVQRAAAATPAASIPVAEPPVAEPPVRWRASANGSFTRIVRTWRSIRGLVRNATEFAKLDGGELKLRFTDVPVAQLLDEVRHNLVARSYMNGLHFLLVSCPRGVAVRADRSNVRRVLHHLLANAITYTPAAGRIAIICEANAQAVRIRVTDTGCGIAAGWVGQVFEPYVQVDAHRLPVGQRGLGLGLAISQRLAIAMGGALEVESELGAGSSFTLTLLRA